MYHHIHLNSILTTPSDAGASSISNDTSFEARNIIDLTNDTDGIIHESSQTHDTDAESLDDLQNYDISQIILECNKRESEWESFDAFQHHLEISARIRMEIRSYREFYYHNTPYHMTMRGVGRILPNLPPIDPTKARETKSTNQDGDKDNAEPLLSDGLPRDVHPAIHELLRHSRTCRDLWNDLRAQHATPKCSDSTDVNVTRRQYSQNYDIEYFRGDTRRGNDSCFRFANVMTETVHSQTGASRHTGIGEPTLGDHTDQAATTKFSKLQKAPDQRGKKKSLSTHFEEYVNLSRYLNPTSDHFMLHVTHAKLFLEGWSLPKDFFKQWQSVDDCIEAMRAFSTTIAQNIDKSIDFPAQTDSMQYLRHALNTSSSFGLRQVTERYWYNLGDKYQSYFRAMEALSSAAPLLERLRQTSQSTSLQLIGLGQPAVSYAHAVIANMMIDEELKHMTVYINSLFNSTNYNHDAGNAKDSANEHQGVHAEADSTYSPSRKRKRSERIDRHQCCQGNGFLLTNGRHGYEYRSVLDQFQRSQVITAVLSADDQLKWRQEFTRNRLEVYKARLHVFHLIVQYTCATQTATSTPAQPTETQEYLREVFHRCSPTSWLPTQSIETTTRILSITRPLEFAAISPGNESTSYACASKRPFYPDMSYL